MYRDLYTQFPTSSLGALTKINSDAPRPCLTSAWSPTASRSWIRAWNSLMASGCSMMRHQQHILCRIYYRLFHDLAEPVSWLLGYLPVFSRSYWITQSTPKSSSSSSWRVVRKDIWAVGQRRRQNRHTNWFTSGIEMQMLSRVLPNRRYSTYLSTCRYW